VAKENYTFSISILAGMIIGAYTVAVFLVGLLYVTNSLEPSQIVMVSDLNHTLDIIEKNCGSTFITKKFGSDDWYVFAKKCIRDSYCKNEYIPLADCLKEKP